jgi:Rad3-related DNA helicase
MMRILSRLFRVARRGPAKGSGTGLLATVFHEVGQAEGSLDPDFALKCHEAARSASEYVKVASDAVDEFFGASSELGPGRGGERRRRYFKDERTSPAWQDVFSRGQELAGTFGELVNRVDKIADLLASKEARPVGPRRELSMDLKNQCGQLEQLVKDIGFVLAAESEQYVFWIEEDPSISRAGPFARFAAAPIEVAPLLKAQLLDQNHSCIFTSATLTVGDSFDYLAGRLGLLLSSDEAPARSDATAVGSPFDYATQVRVLIPRFLPDPRNADSFTDELSDLCVDLFEVSGGRGMVLFTSYSMLSHARDIIAPALAKSDIRVLAQGRDGSRESMLEELRANRGTVLLGTASFWEGIDVPGDALSLLVVAKLPFHVFTEPVIEARCEAIREAGGDPFNEYSLPSAVLRLRQGFGRLIRTGADRGVVVIADRRIITAGYGRAFVDSLPVRAQAAPDSRTLVNAARKFLEG